VEALAEKVAGGVGGVSLGQGVALSAVGWGWLRALPARRALCA